jgi:hypothetical protein
MNVTKTIGDAWAAERIALSLEASILLAIARVGEAIDKAAGDPTSLSTADKWEDVLVAAMHIAKVDYQHGIHTPTSYIVSSTELLSAYMMGREQASLEALDEEEEEWDDAEAEAALQSPEWDREDFDVIALIRQARDEAAQGCGLSDVLYEARVQDAFQAILDQAPDELRAETEAILRKSGFDPDFEPYEPRAGECSLTGIDENCCPCGRHE